MDDKKLDGYVALVLDKESQKFLLDKFPPKHKMVYAHHVTVFYQPTEKILNRFNNSFGHEYSIEILGYAEDSKGQVVKIKHSFEIRNREPHITISTNNVPAKYSNELLEKTSPVEPFVIKGILEFIRKV